LFKVLQIGQAAVDGRLHGLGDESRVLLAATGTAGSRLRVPKANFFGLGEGQQPEGLLIRDAPMVAVALGYQVKAGVEVLDQLLMRARPLRVEILEDQERIDKQWCVGVEYRVEPVITLGGVEV